MWKVKSSRYIKISDEKSSRKGSFFIRESTWCIDIQVVVGHTETKVREIASKKFPSFKDAENIPGIDQKHCPQGRVLTEGASSVVLFLQCWPQKIYHYGILAHEIFHITDHCLRSKGIRLSDDSDEAYAYLIQKLTMELMSELSK